MSTTTTGELRKPDSNPSHRALPTSYSKFRSLSFPNIHLAARRRDPGPAKESDEQKADSEALNSRMREFRIGPADKKSTRSSVSFSSKLQDKCKALGSRISSGRHVAVRAGDRDGSTFPCSNGVTPTESSEILQEKCSDQLTLDLSDAGFWDGATSQRDGSITTNFSNSSDKHDHTRTDGNVLCSKKEYIYNYSREATTLSKWDCSGTSDAHQNAGSLSMFSEVSHSHILDEEIDPKNNDAHVNVVLPQASCDEEQDEAVHEPWEDLTFITYPQELLR